MAAGPSRATTLLDTISLPAYAVLGVLAGPAVAAAAEEADARVTDLVVTATREPRPARELPMAIDRVDARAIAEGRPQVNLSEAVARVPGLVARDRHNFAQDLQVSLRGFGARASFGVRGVRLVADGIPATMPDGQGQAASFDLATAGRIEVLRGPFAALYGNASGGVVQVFTQDAPAVPEGSASLFAGDHGTRRYGVRAGGRWGGSDLVAGASRFRTDGHRAHSAAVREQFNAKLGLAPGEGRLALIASGIHQPASQDPLGLTRAQFEADPGQADAAALLFDTRKSVRQSQAGLVHEVELGGNAFEARAHGGTRAVLQYLAQAGDGPLAAGGVVDLDRRYGGAGLRWRSTRLVAGAFRSPARSDVASPRCSTPPAADRPMPSRDQAARPDAS